MPPIRLAKLLSRGKGGLPSVVTVIDKGIVAQFKAEVYNHRATLGAIAELKAVLSKKGGYSFQEAQDAIVHAFLLLVKPKARAWGIHPSELLSDCPRMLYYRLTHTPESDEVPHLSAELLKHFWVGHQWHMFIQELLKKAGILMQAEAPINNPTYWLVGHTDGILYFAQLPTVEMIVLEIKTINSFGYAQVCKQGRPKDDHIYQAGIYAKELNTQRILFLYVNKDTGEMKEIVIGPEVYGEFQQDAYAKLDRVKASVDQLKIPDRECRLPTQEKALHCVYCSHCFNL